MKISHLDSKRLYNALIAGGNAVIKNQDYLNKINVFPVPDADTGTNLASTMRSIIEGTRIYPALFETVRSMADAALIGARGNSGVIFAQFIHGLSREIKNEEKIQAQLFSDYINNAVEYAYEAILEPVEGTILTVLKDWGAAVKKHSNESDDLIEILTNSLTIAQSSLENTPNQLKILADAGVVDAGAKGLVLFLEGVQEFIFSGNIKKTNNKLAWFDSNIVPDNHLGEIEEQFCTEAIIEKCDLSPREFQETFKPYGNSIITAGSKEKIHFHMHTNSPSELFYKIKDHGRITQIKVDDMKKQVQVSHQRKHSIAIVTDSACDLPEDIIDKYQIHVIPFQISFGENLFLDKVTLTPTQFYEMLANDKHHPKSSQPSLRTVQNFLSFLSSHYKSIIVIHISDKLSGVYQQSIAVAKKIKGVKISVISSNHLSVSQGLIVKRIAEAVNAGNSHDSIVHEINSWIDKTKIYVDVDSLKYMVRGGRVTPLKGFVAKMLNLKPIVSLNESGKSTVHDKSFSRKGNMEKIINIVKKSKDSHHIFEYAIVHSQVPERAQLYSEKLKLILKIEPSYTMDISPVVGVHNGIGAVGIAISYH